MATTPTPFLFSQAADQGPARCPELLETSRRFSLGSVGLNKHLLVSRPHDKTYKKTYQNITKYNRGFLGFWWLSIVFVGKHFFYFF